MYKTLLTWIKFFILLSLVTNIHVMAASRQLAAIMFTNIVGYTALMGEDEQKAFELLRKNPKVQPKLFSPY